eukprot:jgi/Astpho2/7398/Aster-x0768
MEAKDETVTGTVAQFNASSCSYQTDLQQMVAFLNQEHQNLKEERDKLAAERAALDQEKSRIAQVFEDREVVRLNVGGVSYTTTVATLRNAAEPSLFTAMFSGRHTLRPDEDGTLAYPADGTDWKYLLELRAEAEYYGLTELVEQIDRYPYSVVTAQRMSCMNTEDTWMYEDGSDDIVFTVDRPCQLLGVGLCGTDAAYSAELDLLEVALEDPGKVVAKLQQAAQSFTKYDGQVLKLMLPRPQLLLPSKAYMISAYIKGTESHCCENCLDEVIAGGVRISFQAWDSPNGTTDQRGQFPELYIRPIEAAVPEIS